MQKNLMTTIKTIAVWQCSWRVGVASIVLILLVCCAVTTRTTTDDAVGTNYHNGKYRNLNGSGVKQSYGRLGRIIRRSMFEKRVTRPPFPVPVEPLAERLQQPAAEITLYRLGHSTVLIQRQHELWLTDPVFSKRASMVQWAGPLRFHEPPVSIDELPPIKGVIISHNHYDHLDKNAIRQLHPKVKRFYVPLGVGKNLAGWGVPAEKITALDWWQTAQTDEVTLVATPAQHFSGRSLFDTNTTLWASWVILMPEARIYFSGDTGYFKGFKEIGDRYGPFDVTLMETGAYDKDWLEVHMMPKQSLQAHQDVKGRLFIPVHNGTFNLGLHDWNDPFIQVAALAGDVMVAMPTMGQPVVLSKPPVLNSWWLQPTPE